MFSSKLFTPPTPAFGPGSNSYIPSSRKGPINSAAGEDSPPTQVQTETSGTYAGAGNYF